MTATDLIVIGAGALAVAAIALFFWGPRRAGARAALTSGGYQEAMILVKGAYIPSRILVRRGVPTRLRFRREDASPCSETVTFGALGKSARLPRGETTMVELSPAVPGEYEFTCGMGMLRGTLVVE